MSENSSQTGRAWIELDMAALRHNIAALSALLPEGCQLMPVVKANAYGHGAILIAQELNQAGIRAFCVATVHEGAELRKNGIKGEILVLGYTHPQEFPLLWQYDLTQTILDRAYGEVLNACGTPVQAQIKIDTGMHRLGEPWDALEEIARIFHCKNLRITGAYTHLCAGTAASPQDRAFTLEQGQRFYAMRAELKKQGYTLPAVHLLSSYGLLHYPELGGDYARVGIALYGVLSTGTDMRACLPPLWPVLSLKARVAQIREVKAGEGVGYDLQFVPRRDSKLAILTIGYADGLPRNLSCGTGSVLLNGRRAPIAGRICMDQTLVDITDIPTAAPGDTALLIGKSGALEITACDLAEQAGTISNEILSRLSTRLERLA